MSVDECESMSVDTFFGGLREIDTQQGVKMAGPRGFNDALSQAGA